MKKLLILLSLSFAVLYCVYDKMADSIDERKTRAESYGLPLCLQNSGTISGNVKGCPDFDVNLFFDAIEKANPATEEMIDKIFTDFNRKYGVRQTLAGAEVTVTGKDLTTKTRTDQKGNFAFRNLPYGKYTVTVRMPDWPGIAPDTRVTAFDRRDVVLSREDHDAVSNLEPTVALVTLRGKVYEKDQTPAVHADVTATRIYPRSQHGTYGIRTWETTTDENGNYQFKDIPLQNFFLLSSVLPAKGSTLNNFEIRVESPQEIPGNPAVLSTITEELLFLANKWQRLYERRKTITGKNAQILPEADSNESFSDIRAVKGNIITVNDIVLNPE